ncbi:MAG: hypothetical protein IT445_14355 [Phycisphaeraceae bacterium]|nr:hypothetical protein [Phycisphaeraceae bacterium]
MTLRRSILMLVCLAMPAATAALRGDELKISGFWISDVQILALAGGNLTYRTPTGGEVKKALGEIEAVRLADYPTYQQAIEELEAGRAAQAIALLQQAAGKARTPWSGAFINQALWRAYAAAGRFDDFLNVYLALADEGSDAHFLLDPPTQWVGRVDATQCSQAMARIEKSLPKANDAVRPLLESLLAGVREAEQALKQAEPVKQEVAAPDHAATAAPATPTTSPGNAAATSAATAVVLPVKIADSPATSLLRAGDFQQAITQTQSDIQEQGNLAVDLYLHGIALLYQAQASGDNEMLKDAGLAFMRVLVYFPQSDFAGRNLVGGSLLELAFIHEKLGRSEKANELYDRAAAELDPQADTNLYQRLHALRPGSESNN